MSFQLFRENLTQCVDRISVKRIMAAAFLGVVALGFVGGVWVSDVTKASYCQSYNCSDESIDKYGEALSFGVGLAVLASSALLVCMITCAIVCCRVNPVQEDNLRTTEMGYQNIR